MKRILSENKKIFLEVATRAPDQLGVAITRLRLQAALTQEKLAKSAGIRQATVSKTERGVGSTEIKTIYAICAALGLELVLRPRRKTRDFRPEDLF